jgi:predicted CopG family antitoxin
MASTSIRIDRKAHERLKAIAEKEHASLSTVVEKLISRVMSWRSFAGPSTKASEAYREDPAEWQAYQEMVRPWDGTLLDGLENEPAFDNDDTSE